MLGEDGRLVPRSLAFQIVKLRFRLPLISNSLSKLTRGMLVRLVAADQWPQKKQAA